MRGSLADRVAKQLALDPAHLAGTGPDGTLTLSDVLRRAGREPPAAARPPSTRTVLPADDASGQISLRVESTCDAGPMEDARRTLGTLSAEPPDLFDIAIRLCGTALRDFPALANPADASRPESIEITVAGPNGVARIRSADRVGISSIRDAIRAGRSTSPDTGHGEDGDESGPPARFFMRRIDGPPQPNAGEDRRVGAVLTMAERTGSIDFGLELRTGSEEDGRSFLARLCALCLDPRRALL